jgi:ribonuclease HI
MSKSREIDCKCGIRCKTFKVKKDNENKGKTFASCKKCKFFKWLEDSSVVELERESSTSDFQSKATGKKRKFITEEGFSVTIVEPLHGNGACEVIQKPRSAAPPGYSGLMNISDLQQSYFIFTDGSCIGNQSVATKSNPAGWGFVVVRLKDSIINEILQSNNKRGNSSNEINISTKEFFDTYLTKDCCEQIIELYAPMIIADNEHYTTRKIKGEDGQFLDPEKLSKYSFGAQVASNNTGELTAIGEVLLWLKDYTTTTMVSSSSSSSSFLPKFAFILYDSEYAAKSITGEFNGAKNQLLIGNIRRVYHEVKAMIRNQYNPSSGSTPVVYSASSSCYLPGIHFLKIKAHNNHYWNEYADYLANRGSSGNICFAGRYKELLAEKSVVKSNAVMKKTNSGTDYRGEIIIID